MNKKADFGFKVLKKLTSKTEKKEKMPQNSQFWASFGVYEEPNLNFAVGVMLYFDLFLNIKMVRKPKSRAIACIQVFCVKNADLFTHQHF